MSHYGPHLGRPAVFAAGAGQNRSSVHGPALRADPSAQVHDLAY